MKNFRFLLSCTGHFLPAVFLRKALQDRYPDFDNKGYDICIEGFQRSGNTYFVALFHYWNNAASIAHHTHLAGTVKEALDRGIPTAVLIRRPEDAIASIITWNPHLAVTTALISYTLFYRSLWKYSHAFVVLHFDDVTSCSERCVAKINERFGSRFNSSPLSPAIRDEVFANIESDDQKLERGNLSSSLPKPEKALIKGQLRPMIRSNSLFDSADRWFRKYELLAQNPKGHVDYKSRG